MPYELAWEGVRGVVAKYSGIISANDLEQICEQVTIDPRWDTLRYVIVDALAIDGVDVDTSTGSALARPNILLIGAASVHGPVLFAIVTDNDALLRMLQRQRDLKVFPYETREFDSIAPARAWIDSVLELPWPA
jgi:hypothetical protein